ncbi:hypothetical protein LUZ60_004367 [Juncus effusus]|nr:hypothetical protein LUZ60_004367 [Juncus effusus]
MEDNIDIVELEDWETVQSNIDPEYFSFDQEEEEEGIKTEEDSLSIGPYKEPDQLKKHSSLISSNSSETGAEGGSMGEGKGGRGNGFDWRKFSLNLVKYLGGFGRIKPIWCVSVAFLGLVVLKNRVFKMKSKERKIPLNNKKEMQFVSNALQLNEALSVVRRVPVIRIPSPSGTTNPWVIVPVR